MRNLRDVPVAMAPSSVWAARSRTAARRFIEFLWVVVVYLSSELLIWGLSRLLSLIRLQYLASILGMVVAFMLMVASCRCYPSAEKIYEKHLKSKVNFINAHLGLGFPIPLIMLDQSHVLDGRHIGRIIGNFIITNLASWSLVYVMSLFTMTLWARSRYGQSKATSIIEMGLDQPLVADSLEPLKLPSAHLGYESGIYAVNACDANVPMASDDTDATPTKAEISIREIRKQPGVGPDTHWRSARALYPIIISITIALLIGAPIAAATGDVRILDICVLWFVWISWVRMQRLFKDAHVLSYTPKLKNAIATMMNPVLATTLLMTGYVHAKSFAFDLDLADVLRAFSRGVPLYAIWTASVTGAELLSNPELYVGAGDIALSVLEVGIVIWGFKLFECRRQLWSMAGLFAAAISVIAAVGNVYLCVLSGRLIGLEKPESLAFAARSTTLALAKPAIDAVGGNLAVNAALVVSNGILGQLVYPFVLDRLGVQREGLIGSRRSSIASSIMTTSSSSQSQTLNKTRREDENVDDDDNTATIAAGIAIGINGAAMGVAYLYETKSRAAPYAALSMTVFGVMTVVFTSVGPFKAFILTLAG